MPRSHRGTPESGSRVPRPYAGGRNDVMPFTAEELMLFKEAQSSASFAGALHYAVVIPSAAQATSNPAHSLVTAAVL